ncbi:hypothetical protein PhCBS80983_g01527 [Powellomyces hirtus]|uniref:Radical SAM core domain-containing protein n=1 Tax=Powellomyces hirtus TaxID=109895 RepID=A0A507EC87_9FUNG|nr:hypothetical protein PhCBS80983_g01527 [Powellomyces hirtus]
MLSLHEAKRGILLVKEAGMRKINFAGGEPFLYPDFLGELVVYSKNIGVEAVSIVSNGSKITSSFMRQYGSYIDVLAVSCDSFASETNKVIGRKSGAPLRRLLQIRSWCSQYRIKFKVNTVVNRFNYREDMNDSIGQLQPFRWKCFQVLLDESENNGDGTLRDARPLLISKAEYETFIANHAGQPSLIQEPNDIMRSSYLILDEYMRFLGKEGDYAVSDSILDVGVQKALQSVLWRQSRFYQRDGVYDWKSNRAGLIQENPSALNW